MEALLNKIIDQLNGSVFTLLGILLVAFWGTYKLGCLIQQYAHHKGKIDKIDDLSENMIELKVKVDLIYQNTNPNKTVAAASPISLTDNGRDISIKLDAEKTLDKYFAKLEAAVDASCPKNAYDVQTASMEAAKSKMITFLNADEINALKAVAFAKGLIIEDIMSVYGVLLRDRMLEKKGMPVSDVDKHQK